MITRSLSRVGAVAAVSISLTACASVPVGVSPESVLTTVIANLPAVISSTSSPSTPSRPSRGGGTTIHRIPASPPPSSAADQVLRTANSYVGVKYVWGGNTPREGFDCSGFTKYVFAKYGVTLPRTSREQARAGSPVAADFRALRPGDLMMFAEPGQAISHVAIYAGNGIIIHSSTSTGGVGYTDLNNGGEWFVEYFVVARRVL